MLQTNNATRDIGQSEVCRLLLSEPLYQSSFEYIYISLDISQKLLTIKNNNLDYKKSILEFYANRFNEDIDKDILSKIYNVIDFAKTFSIIKNKLIKRSNSDKIVILTKPDVYYNPYDSNKYKDYCYYNLIKYSNWTINDKQVIYDKNDVENHWHKFLLIAPEHVKQSIE
jgi:hypothetical protein